jgi:hypothetical protein
VETARTRPSAFVRARFALHGLIGPRHAHVLVVSTENPFRLISSSSSVELRCPHCERNLYLAPPEALVSLTACPHLDCQHVALVCTGEALGGNLLGTEAHDGLVAMTFERFVEASGRVRSFDVSDAVFLFVGFIIYIVTPMTMWIYAWRDLELLLLIVVLTGPAALIGLGMVVVMIVGARHDRRDRRQLAAVRRQAFARARWQVGFRHAR